jgi:hypothetical protein
MGETMSRSPTIGQAVRKLLLDSDDGLTIKELSDATGRTQDVIISTLSRTYGCYVGRWCKHHPASLKLSAVYYCVVVPAGAPNPEGEISVDERREQHRKNAMERAAELRELRERQRLANAKIRAEMEAQRLARREMRAQIKAEADALKAQQKAEREERKRKRLDAMQPAAPEGYKPAKTVWVTPPPWSH